MVIGNPKKNFTFQLFPFHLFRFYFENPGIFTRAQLAEIRRSSLARIICDNGDRITHVPREAFRLGPMVSCAEIPQMDLSKWRE